MKTVSIREFNRHFRRLRKETCQVKDRDEVVGTWLPVPRTAPAVDFSKRVRQDFKEKLPITGADLLKAGKKR